MTTETAPPREPLTERGRRTRERLLAAATEVFTDQGFGSTAMGDIATAAGVSHGTVYTYFETKEAVLLAVIQQQIDDLVSSLRTSTATDPRERIADANARYLAAYAPVARLLRVVEEASLSDERFGRILTDLRRTHVRRVAAAIRRLQDEGAASTDLDAHTAAAALCSMVEGFGRHWYGNGEQHDETVASHTLTTLWARALGLPDDPQADPQDKE